MEEFSFWDNQFFTGGLVLGALAAAVAFARQFATSVKDGVIRFFTTSVFVPSDDRLQDFLLLALGEQFRRSRGIFVAKNFESSHDPIASPVNEDIDTPAYTAKPVLTPGFGRHLVWVKNRPAVLSRSRRDLDASFGPSAYEEQVSLWLPFGTAADVEELLAKGVDIANEQARQSEQVEVYHAVSTGWRSVRSFRPRPLRTVFTPPEISETLLRDLRRFLEARVWYEDRGIPYRRGYLLHGPPGTGKSSLVSAVVGELKMKLYQLSLRGSTLSDTSLVSLVSEIPARSVLLLEDIDCCPVAVTDGLSSQAAETSSEAFNGSLEDFVSGSKETVSIAGEEGHKSLTTSGLLNAIDGVTSGEGHVLIMTANKPARLHPALVRGGRVDRIFRVGLPEEPELKAFFATFYGGTGEEETAEALAPQFAAEAYRRRWTIAEAQRLLLQHRESATEAVASLASARGSAAVGAGDKARVVSFGG